MHASTSTPTWMGTDNGSGNGDDERRPTLAHSQSFDLSAFSLDSPTTPTVVMPSTLATSTSMRQQLSLQGDGAAAVAYSAVQAAGSQPSARPQVASRQRSASQPQGRNRALSNSDDGYGGGKKRMQSCDICRIRKVKCVRPDDAASLATGKCKQCLANHAKCTYAYVPKKPGPQTASAKAMARREDKDRPGLAPSAAAAAKGTSSSSSSAGSSNNHQARSTAIAAQRRGSEQYTGTVSSGGEQSSNSSRKSSLIEHGAASALQPAQHPHPHPPAQHLYSSWDYFPDPYGAQPASAPPHLTSMQFHHQPVVDGSSSSGVGRVGVGEAHIPTMMPQWVTHGFAHDVLTPLHVGPNPLEAALSPVLDMMPSPQQQHGVYANAMPMLPGGAHHHVVPAGLPMVNHPASFSSPPFQQTHPTSPFRAPQQSPFITAPATTTAADLGDSFAGVTVNNTDDDEWSDIWHFTAPP